MCKLLQNKTSDASKIAVRKELQALIVDKHCQKGEVPKRWLRHPVVASREGRTLEELRCFFTCV